MSPFLRTGVKIACLRLDEKMEVVIELLKSERRKSEKISALSLMIFVGMSVSWLTFVDSKLKISFKISSLSTCEKEKREQCFLLHASPILSMLGWLRYFTEDLITEALMLSEMGSQLTDSPIIRKIIIRTYSYYKKKPNILGAEGDREANSQNHINWWNTI